MHVQEQRVVTGPIAITGAIEAGNVATEAVQQPWPLHTVSGEMSREVSLTSDDDALSLVSSRVVSPTPPPPPLPPATQVTCLQGLAWCLYSKRQFAAEESVLRDLLKHMDADQAIVPGSPAARQKVMVMRRIGSCLGTQKRLPEAVEAFQACIAQAQVLLPNVRSHALPFCTLILATHVKQRRLVRAAWRRG
jgi:hypothetical protein